MLQRVDARRKYTSDQCNTGHCGVAEVQAGYAGAIRGDNTLQQGVKGVGLGLPFAVLWCLIARRAHGDCGLGQPKRKRLPCQRVVLQEVA